jgi:hypothetical protein
MNLIEAKCPRGGCTFLKESDDPTICKCAAVQCGKRAKPSDVESKMDDMLNLPEETLEAGLLRVAIERLNARASA